MQDQQRHPHPLKKLLVLTGAAVLLCLASTVAQGELARSGLSDDVFYFARADTDTVGLHDVDSLLSFLSTYGVDSLRTLVLSMEDSLLWLLVDSVAGDTNVRVDRYLSGLRRPSYTASMLRPERLGFGAGPVPSWRHDVSLDTARYDYTARMQVQNHDIRYPVTLTRPQYRQYRLDVGLKRNWRELVQARRNRQNLQRRGGLGFGITIPGGRQSGFTTIFGKNEVNLRVTGSADIRPGFVYNKSEQQISLGQGSRLDPSFKMDLRLGVNGTIGDKLDVEVDWDTGRSFDYQNQLKLLYTGYEDEIIQNIEAGNVYLQVPSSLIRGGQSLFGLKSELQIGGFRLTTVASQQEGQSSSLTLEGGAETTEFNSKPTDYNERTHYFLSYYFRNRWEDALSDPPNIILDPVFSGITDIEVWKLTPVAPEEKNVRQVVAMVDLGESPALVRDADEYTSQARPSAEEDQYTEAELETRLRPGDAVPRDYLESDEMDFPLTSVDFQVGQFKKLEVGRDYDLDALLGYITLKQRIQESEALAVSFRYLAGGQELQVGDFSSETGGGDNSQSGERIVLKLLKPVNLQQPANLGEPNELNPAAWYLEMRNIYRLGSSLMPTEFVLDIVYEPPGSGATKTLSGITGQSTLIQVLGLDRLNEDGAPQPDDRFDYMNNYTVLEGSGTLIFPYLEPFGDRMEALINQSGMPEADKNLAKDQYVFDDLYTKKRVNAVRNTQHNVYRIQGSFKGGIPSFYDLRAYAGVVPGSVRITSGGVPLTEGTDFTVDYQGGTVNIINRSYLTSGRDLVIEREENALINFQKKTVLGARLDYDADERYNVGGTVMRMSQKSVTDKFRIGDEPISNLIWGIDGMLDVSPRWLTRAIDAVPLLQTKEASRFKLQAEFAQLRPGHSLTNAFKDEQRDLRKQGRNFYPDELAGTSFVDDFEGFENVLQLTRPGAWLLSSAPVIGSTEADMEPEIRLTNDTRSAIGWYNLNDHVRDQLGSPNDPAVTLVSPQAVFPNRKTSSQERILTTFDFFFTPHERGPYNYNMDLGGFLDDPRTAWGGMTQRLSEGNTDFTSKNIEFVEFVFQPFPSGGDADPDARLIIDLGRISEEIIPDNKLNTEDGLSTSEGGPVGILARLSTGQQNQTINPIDPGDRITEDLGLDGLASFPNNKFETEGGLGTEQQKFQEFLDALQTTSSALYPRELAREKAKALRDPSGDDYHYFLDETFYSSSTFYPEGATIQQRFTHFFAGHELNSFEAQRELSDSSDPTGNARLPDTEDINFNSAADTDNSYFQYELPLNLSKLDDLAAPEATEDYVINEIEAAGGGGTGWYLVRIPVRDFTRKVGGIQDFTLIESVRIWTTGHTAPITLRFATLELVGSQWRTAEEANRRDINDQVLPEVEDPLLAGTISIESVNNEENTGYAIPNGAVRNRIREAQSGTLRDAREQSMVLHAENLRPGRQLAVFQTYGAGVDFLRYRNLRMFMHLNGSIDDQPLMEDDRGEVRVFIRLGANEVNDYYEIEQPLTPSPLDLVPEESIQRADYLWRTYQPNPDGGDPAYIDLNSLNMELSMLNQLKFRRDEYRDSGGMTFPSDSVFWSDVHGGLQSAIDEFAAPGTRVGVRGTPSLASVSTIVVGIRNTSGAERVLTDVNVWINELRVAGYDEETGMAGLLNADLELADFARVRATAQLRTDGFDGLQSTLGDRQQINNFDWTVNTQVNMHEFIPTRYGWSLPVSMEIRSSSSTPRFDPNRGDVRVNSLKEAVAADSTLSAEEITERQQAIDQEAQTFSTTRSYTARMQKSRSRSPILKNTLDVLSLSYSFSDAQGRSPRQTINDSWRWSVTANYSLQVPRARLVYPFWFLRGKRRVGWIGDLTFNYLPDGVTYNVSANRAYSENQQRRDPVRQQNLDRPLEVAFPLRQNHRMSHSRRFTLGYSPFEFLRFNMETNTNQTLNAIGADTTFSVILLDSEGVPTRLDGTRIQDLVDDGTIDQTDIGTSAFELFALNTPGTIEVARRAFSRSTARGVRTEDYRSRFGATFSPRFRGSGMRWLDLQDIGYTSSFTWRNGSAANNRGAQVGASVSTRAGITLRAADLVERLPIYQRLEQEQRAAQAEAEQRRQARAQVREARREARREERRLLREQADSLRNVQADGEDEDVEPDDPDELEEPGRRGFPGEEMAPPEGRFAPQGIEPEGAPQVAPADTTEPAGLRVRIPHFLMPKSLLRRMLLAIAGIQDASFTYNGNVTSAATNVGRPDEEGLVDPRYSLYDAIFNSRGPPLGYRLGLESTIDPMTNRVITDNLQVTDRQSQSDRIQGRLSLRPSQSLSLSLDWNLEYGQNSLLTYRLLDDGTPGADTTQSGDGRTTIWSFGSSYMKLFQRQLNRFYDDCGPDCGSGIDAVLPDTVYTTALTNETVLGDFISSFLTGAAVPQPGKVPFPLPSWRVTYSGISNWPLIRSFTTSASLRHAFNGEYSADFSTNLRGGAYNDFNLGGGPVVAYTLPNVEVEAARVNKRFQPLIGLDLSIKGGIQTSFNWNQSHTYSLSTTNNVVSDTRSNEMSLTASFATTGLRLPFMSSRLNNRINFSLTVSRSVNDDRSFYIRRALEAAITDPDFLPEMALEEPYADVLTKTSRIQIQPKIAYQFSNIVTADIFVEYEDFIGDSRRLPYTRIEGGFNVRVNFSH